MDEAPTVVDRPSASSPPHFHAKIARSRSSEPRRVSVSLPATGGSRRISSLLSVMGSTLAPAPDILRQRTRPDWGECPAYRGGVAHAGAEFWDRFFRQRRESGNDLDWEGRWTRPFLMPLREAGARSVLELGCGTGNDAARRAEAGFSVTAIDSSGEAIGRARARFGQTMHFFSEA